MSEHTPAEITAAQGLQIVNGATDTAMFSPIRDGNDAARRQSLRFYGILSSPFWKIFRFTVILICGITDSARAARRDVSRSSRSVARVAMDACGVRLASPSQAKRCGVRRNRVVLAPRPWRLSAPPVWDGNGDNKGRSPGRARISRKAIARGRPGCPGCTCQSRVRFFLPCTRCLRVPPAPGLPCAL
jgi:hypothetical protein